MASRNTVNLITELERRYLECNICTEAFDEDEHLPRLLPCHHPFCSECIKRLGRRKDTIKCPTCNAIHNVKKQGPADFPKDNTRRDLTSFLKAHSDAFKKCDQCVNIVDVTYQCQQCYINLCETCRGIHEKENNTHNLIINKPETFQEENDNLNVCQNLHHERSKLKYFCNSLNCQKVLCPSCVIAEHRDISKHKLEDIEEAFKMRKNELGNDTKSLRTRISNVESTMQKVLDETNTLQDEKNKFLNNLNAIYNRGIADLKDRRQNLLDRYNTAFKKKESKLFKRKNNLNSFLQNANECCSISEQLINRNSMSSFLNVHQTINVHVQRYLNAPVEDSICDKNDAETNIDFNDYLQMFNGNVEILENARRKVDLESLPELAKAKFPQSKTTIELHRIQPLKLRGMLWPVFAAYATTSVSMTIKSNQVGFDRFTLYPSLYISDDNKTMSNKQSNGMYPSDSIGIPVIFTRLKNFGTSGEIQTMINIDFSDYNGGNLLFKFGIGNHEDGVFKGTALLECTKCVWTYFFGLYPITGYCVLVKNDTNQMLMGNHLSLILHYHRNGSIAMYVVNYYFGYSHRIFQFKPFHNQSPRVYIEKMEATDIVISSTEKSNIFNMTKMIIALLVIIYFYMF